MAEEEIVDRVSKSPIQTLDLDQYYPVAEIVEIDLKDWLYKGLIVKEQEFRDEVQQHDWSQYRGKHVALFCSTDAIVPIWTWMLMQASLYPEAEDVYYGRKDDVLTLLFKDKLQAEVDLSQFEDKPAVVKGCDDKTIPSGAFMEAVKLLMPRAKSIMYGEPCSTVPVYKRPVRRKSSATTKNS